MVFRAKLNDVEREKQRWSPSYQEIVHASSFDATHRGAGIRDKFNDWGWRGCNIFVSVLGGNGTKITPTGDRFDQAPGQMR